jgi:hypothetical protein
MENHVGNFFNFLKENGRKMPLKVMLRHFPNKITKNDLYVNGDLDLAYYGGITSLPFGLKVDGNLNIQGSGIEYLPEDIIVKGSINMEGSSIRTFPRSLKHIRGSLNISNTRISFLPNDLSIDGSLNICRSNDLRRLPDRIKILGDLYLGEGRVMFPPTFEIRGTIFHMETDKIYVEEYNSYQGVDTRSQYGHRINFKSYTLEDFIIKFRNMDYFYENKSYPWMRI